MAGVEGQSPFLPVALYQVSCRLSGCSSLGGGGSYFRRGAPFTWLGGTAGFILLQYA